MAIEDRNLTVGTRLEAFCQNSGLSRHGGKLTQKAGARVRRPTPPSGLTICC